MSTDDDIDPALAMSGQFARLKDERDTGRNTLARGVILLFSIPIVVLAAALVSSGVGAFAPMIVAGVYAIVGGATGVVSVGVGALQSRSATKRIDQLEASRIPEARLLKP